MGVYVKGMEMPTCCAECDLHNPFSEIPYCRRLLQVIPFEGRLENCPLAEVKTPYDKLIDAADFIRNSTEEVKFRPWYYRPGFMEKTKEAGDE